MTVPIRISPIRRALAGLLAAAFATASGLAAAPSTPESQAPAGAAPVARLTDAGSTRRLEVLPLVDWFTTGAPLRGEAGVSYLVRTDRATILFDVGGNLDGSSPSPLMANMKALGVTLAEIDTVVISHPHMDHVGGQSHAKAASFALDREPVDLAGKRVVVPTAMSHPGVRPVQATGPMVLAPGVATTGPMAGRLFVGPVEEQALAVRLEGKGIVLIVGCGHQGLEPLLARAAAMFAEPLYGVIGGLHYPIPGGRLRWHGIDVQRWATWGLGAPPSAAEVQRDIARLQATGLQWISLSPHDSSDEMIELFRQGFGERFHDLRVGQVQRLSAGAP